MDDFLVLWAACFAYFMFLPMERLLHELLIKGALSLALAASLLHLPLEEILLAFFAPGLTSIAPSQFSALALSMHVLFAVCVGCLLSIPMLIFSETLRALGDIFDTLCGLNMSFSYDAQQAPNASVLGTLLEKASGVLIVASPFLLAPGMSLSKVTVSNFQILDFLQLFFFLCGAVFSLLLVTFAACVPLCVLIFVCDFSMSLIGKFQTGLQLQGMQQLVKICLCVSYLWGFFSEYLVLASDGLARMAASLEAFGVGGM